MHHHSNRCRIRRHRRARRGYLTFEVIIAFLILMIAILGVFQFGTAMLFKQNLMHAAIVGAREAAKDASVDEIESSMNAILSHHALKIGSRAAFILEDFENPIKRGTFECDPLPFPEIDTDKVRITLCVDMASRPFWNPLRFFGINLNGKTMTVYAVAPKE